MKRFKNILYVVSVEVDDERPSLQRALALAHANGARLTVAAIADEVPRGTDLEGLDLTVQTLQDAVNAQARARLDALIGDSGSEPEPERQVLTGKLFLEVIRAVLREGHDLVMKCAGPDGLLGRLFGSDDMHLLRKCPCPVWLTRPTPPAGYRRVLAAVDLDWSYPDEELQVRGELNQRILEIAASLALAEPAELHVVHAWKAIPEDVMRGGLVTTPHEIVDAYVAAERNRRALAMESALAALGRRMGDEAMGRLKLVRHLPKGWARDELPLLARRVAADIVVLGTLARTGVPGLLMGNTAEAILHQIDCSVLALKPDGFQTPVG
jgi:nucleotide-binding universal stress UspA family protein